MNCTKPETSPSNEHESNYERMQVDADQTDNEILKIDQTETQKDMMNADGVPADPLQPRPHSSLLLARAKKQIK